VDEIEPAGLASVTLPTVSAHAGRPLDDLALHALGVAVVSLRRADGKGQFVDGATLAGGDTLVISGTPAALVLAEEKLLKA
jgi:CPA2 family monovalent cation:H+ antiporter-2